MTTKRREGQHQNERKKENKKETLVKRKTASDHRIALAIVLPDLTGPLRAGREEGLDLD
jgi:hypothetical protein